MHKLFIIILILIASKSLAQTIEIDDKNLNQVISDLLDSADIPGLSFAILKGNRIAYYQSFGVKSTESKNTIDKNTIFEAASLTKPVVAYCALKLVEQKKLEIDRPLFKYLKYEPAAHDNRYKAITARMVLSHTTGFPNWRSNRKGDTLNIKFQPGLKFSYSGEGFVYLQKVIEKIMDSDLNSIASSFVFVPLKMNRSSLVFNNDDNYALGHDLEKVPKQKFKPNSPNAAYSLHTTAEDYAKFLKELTKPKHIKKKLTKQMFRLQLNTDKSDPKMGWGLGVGLNFVNKDTYVWHWGDNKIFKSFFIFVAKTGDGFVYFSNSENGLSVVKQFIKLVLGNEEIMSTWNKYEQF